jgi:hypothetical protein
MSINHTDLLNYSKKNEFIIENHSIFIQDVWVKNCSNSSKTNVKKNRNRILHTNKIVKPESVSYFDIEPDIIFKNIDTFSNKIVKPRSFSYYDIEPDILFKNIDTFSNIKSNTKASASYYKLF